MRLRRMPEDRLRAGREQQFLLVGGKFVAIERAFPARRGSRGNRVFIKKDGRFQPRPQVELADGSTRSELLFAGQVRFVGEERDVEILVTERDDPLVGVGLMSGCRLAIDFTRGTLSLTRPNKRVPRR